MRRWRRGETNNNDRRKLIRELINVLTSETGRDRQVLVINYNRLLHHLFTCDQPGTGNSNTIYE